MKKFSILTFLYLLSAMFVFAQPSNYQNTLSLSAQKFTYKDPLENRFLTEIDISFTQSQIRNMGNFVSDTLDVIVEISQNEKLAVRGWHLFPLKKYLVDTLAGVFLDQFTFALNKGDYKIQITVKNRNNENSIYGELNDKLSLKTFAQDVLSSSDLLISDLITKPQPGNDRYIKNGIFVQPFPFKIFSPAKPLLFFYMEIYNLQGMSINNLKIKTMVIDKDGKVVKKFKSPKIYGLGDGGFCMSGQNVMALKDGAYSLNAELWDGDRKLFEKESLFRIIKKKRESNRQIKDNNIDPEYLTKSLAEINDEIFVLKHIIKEKTWKNLQQMNIENKRRNLTLFWKKNDLNKDTPENEFKIHYLKLVNYVRTQYSDGNNDGVDTDMGRIILMYDKPSYINRSVDDEISGQSVELWKYQNLQAIFLFIQENFTGPFRLVHSTMKGEMYDPFWIEYLKLNPDLEDY